MGQGGFSQDASYYVCVKLGVDHMGRPQFSDALAHFSERRNAVAYKSEWRHGARPSTSTSAPSITSRRRQRKSGSWTTGPRPTLPTRQKLMRAPGRRPSLRLPLPSQLTGTESRLTGGGSLGEKGTPAPHGAGAGASRLQSSREPCGPFAEASEGPEAQRATAGDQHPA